MNSVKNEKTLSKEVTPYDIAEELSKMLFRQGWQNHGWSGDVDIDSAWDGTVSESGQPAIVNVKIYIHVEDIASAMIMKSSLNVEGYDNFDPERGVPFVVMSMRSPFKVSIYGRIESGEKWLMYQF